METLFIVVYLVILLILSVYGINRYHTIYLFKKYRKKKINPESTFKKLPKVTVQLPVFNEKYVVERLIDSVTELDYPRELLEIQVLDDSTDETVEIARNKCLEKENQGFNIKYIHRTDRSGFKAGALEKGLAMTDSEFIAVFDADFLPPKDFINKTVHYFTDNKIGMVQARWDHVNRGYSLLTECQSILLDGHFMIEHTARNRSGRFFNFNGTAGIWRKATITDAGGWQHDTLTEDLDLSYRAQLKGWNFIYLPELCVPAELPVEMSAFKSQQFRWAKGSIQTCMKLAGKILKSDLPFKIKSEAFFHIGANFAYPLMVLLTVLMPLSIIVRYKNGWQNIAFLDLPVFIFATLSVFLFYFYTEVIVLKETLSVQNRSTGSIFKYLPFVVAIGIGLSINNTKAVIEALFKKQSPFNRTPKYNVSMNEKHNVKIHTKKVVNNSYRLKKIDWVSIVEFCLAVYMAYALFFIVSKDLFISLPLTMLFFIGFAYTSFLSLLHAPLSFIFSRKS